MRDHHAQELGPEEGLADLGEDRRRPLPYPQVPARARPARRIVNFPELSDITPAKVQALRERIARLGLDLRLVDEQFTRGSGKGGQKINKTSNAVQLRYPALGLVVKCQRERKRSLNRFLALRELVDEVEVRISPETSERLKEISRIRKKKARGRKRGAGPVPPSGGDNPTAG
ncbi:MAG TPA: hypothetical protein DCW72_05890 [Elusimicrobia bacterium]|nr:hypothetical protein [Elusimicrobiota bacterium]